MYRAFLEVRVEAQSLTDALNRIEIAMLNWPGAHWCYVNPTAPDFADIAEDLPHPISINKGDAQ